MHKSNLPTNIPQQGWAERLDIFFIKCYKCIKVFNTLMALLHLQCGEFCLSLVQGDIQAQCEKGNTMILLDYRDKRPIYEQVVEKLERLIVSGGLEPLTRMPSVRSLAIELSVNPNTIQRAYAQLEQDGYLYTVSGRGSYVTAENEWRENKQGKVLREWQAVTLQAKESGITEEQLVEKLHQIYGSEKELSAARQAEVHLPGQGIGSTDAEPERGTGEQNHD